MAEFIYKRDTAVRGGFLKEKALGRHQNIFGTLQIVQQVTQNQEENITVSMCTPLARKNQNAHQQAA